MRKIVVFSGAGISADSGLKTFRDADGLWEGHAVEEVATPQAWQKDKSTVLRFYNERRAQLLTVEPNAAHSSLVDLEKAFRVSIITQNVDDLHERAGSSHVLHLHGELFKARSEKNQNLIVPWKKDIHLGDLAEDGAQLRPHVVWFGEAVPAMDEAVRLVSKADLLIVVGTSLLVYPAAGLIHYCSSNCQIHYIDPNPNEDIQGRGSRWHLWRGTAAEKMPLLASSLINKT
ncbi:MAG TPA: NAD-dependent deacylase [Saprospiraceae bacterium]|nr:NAD-dependent deacylase [Saprospiraceae bacterium]